MDRVADMRNCLRHLFIYLLTLTGSQDSAVSVLEWDTTNKGNKYMADNPFIVRTPSTAVVDMQGYIWSLSFPISLINMKSC